ncbi:MAG: hypothetical protein ACKV2O_12520 [Acidimicrobiales bacterium]
MTSEERGDAVELTFPASSRFVRLSRMAAATLAAELDFDVEEIEDIRIAVDELVTLLVGGVDGAPVGLRFEAGDGRLAVEGRCRGATVPAAEMSDLVEAILSATIDEHRVDLSAGHRSFSFHKVRHANGRAREQ